MLDLCILGRGLFSQIFLVIRKISAPGLADKLVEPTQDVHACNRAIRITQSC